MESGTFSHLVTQQDVTKQLINPLIYNGYRGDSNDQLLLIEGIKTGLEGATNGAYFLIATASPTSHIYSLFPDKDLVTIQAKIEEAKYHFIEYNNGHKLSHNKQTIMVTFNPEDQHVIDSLTHNLHGLDIIPGESLEEGIRKILIFVSNITN